jgi:hypothetical protein
MKTKSILISILTAHLFASGDDSSTSSNTSSSAQPSESNLAGAWKDEKSGIVLHLQDDGSLYMSVGQEKKGEGSWSVSGDRLKIQFTIHGAPMGNPEYMQFQATDKNHLVLTESNGKIDHWTRQ